MRNLYVAAAFQVAVVLVLLTVGEIAGAAVFLILLIPTVDYIRRQRRYGKPS